MTLERAHAERLLSIENTLYKHIYSRTNVSLSTRQYQFRKIILFEKWNWCVCYVFFLLALFETIIA